MSHLGDRLSALVDGELDGAELDRAHAHLASCEQCRTEAAELRALKQKLRALMTGAPAEAAMTRRLIAMTGPGGPMPPRRRLLRVVPGRRPTAGPVPKRPRAGTRPPGLARRRRYLVLGTVSLVVGLGTAAFTAGGGGDAAPGPRITPSVEMYSVEHAITTGEVPFLPRRPSPPRPTPTRRHRHREVRVLTLTCPVSRPARQHGARRGSREVPARGSQHGRSRRHGRNGRPPLLLAAALAVAVPGFLVAACSGQAGAQQNDAVAAARAATGGRCREPGRRPGTVLAVRLLAQAAQAAIVTSYQGEEVVTRWSQSSGGSVLVSDIWHVSGGQTVTQTLDAGLPTQPYLSSDDDGQAPEGVLGVTVPLVQLLETHYVVAYAGAGSAGNRTAQVVEARRADGSLAARFWLDDATKLPLEREVFDTAAQLISRDVFINVRFANAGVTHVPAARRPIRGTVDRTASRRPSCSRCAPAAGWSRPSCPAASRCSPAPRRRRVPAPCSTSATPTACRSSRCSSSAATWRPAWPAGAKPPWHGHVIFVADRISGPRPGPASGMVYTVVADAPTQTVDAVVGALPHDRPPGFWKRMTRGLVRLASLVNPFR